MAMIADTVGIATVVRPGILAGTAVLGEIAALAGTRTFTGTAAISGPRTLVWTEPAETGMAMSRKALEGEEACMGMC